jgi:hypothetical protein
VFIAPVSTVTPICLFVCWAPTMRLVDIKVIADNFVNRDIPIYTEL